MFFTSSLEKLAFKNAVNNEAFDCNKNKFESALRKNDFKRRNEQQNFLMKT